MSLPSRGAWIEIDLERADLRGAARRSPHGERGLKLGLWLDGPGVLRRSPSRGAWIEIVPDFGGVHPHQVAPLTGSVD